MNTNMQHTYKEMTKNDIVVPEFESHVMIGSFRYHFVAIRINASTKHEQMT